MTFYRYARCLRGHPLSVFTEWARYSVFHHDCLATVAVTFGKYSELFFCSKDKNLTSTHHNTCKNQLLLAIQPPVDNWKLIHSPSKVPNTVRCVVLRKTFFFYCYEYIFQARLFEPYLSLWMNNVLKIASVRADVSNLRDSTNTVESPLNQSLFLPLEAHL